jgi:hypothetical protein
MEQDFSKLEAEARHLSHFRTMQSESKRQTSLLLCLMVKLCRKQRSTYAVAEIALHILPICCP